MVKIIILLAIAASIFYQSTAFSSKANFFKRSGTTPCFGTVDKGPLIGLLSPDRFDNKTSCGQQWIVLCTLSETCLDPAQLRDVTVTIVGVCAPGQCPNAGDGLGSISISEEAFAKIAKRGATFMGVDLNPL